MKCQDCNGEEVEDVSNKQFDYMIKNNSYKDTLDTWGGKERTERYKSLDGLGGQVNYKDEIFVLTSSASGGVGMGSYPASTTVTRIKR